MADLDFFEYYLNRGYSEPIMQAEFTRKGYDYADLKKRYFQKQQAARTEKMAGLPTTQEVDPERITPGVMEDMDQRLRESMERPEPFGPPRAVSSFLSGASNIPQTYADIENLASKGAGFLLDEYEPGGDVAGGQPEVSPAEIGYIPGFSEASEYFGEKATEGASEEYKNITHKWMHGAGEVADVAVPAGGVTKAAKGIKKAVTLGWLDDIVEGGMRGFTEGARFVDAPALKAMEKISYDSIFPKVGDDFTGAFDPAKRTYSADEAVAEAGGDLVARMKHDAQLDPKKAGVYFNLRPRNHMEHLAAEEYRFLNGMRHGKVPLTDDNFVRALEITDRINRSSKSLKELAAWKDIQTVRKTREAAEFSLEREKGNIFKQGYENLGIKERILDPIGRAFKGVFDNEYAAKEFGRIAKDDGIYGALRYLRDIGNTRNIPIQQATYTRYRRGMAIPEDPIAKAKNAKWFGVTPPTEGAPIATGESFSDVFQGYWHINKNGVASFVKETPMPREFYDDLDLYLVARRVTTDIKDRAEDSIRAANLEGTLKAWLKRVDNEITDAELRKDTRKKVQGALDEIQSEQAYLKSSITPDDVTRMAQVIDDLKTKWGTEFGKLEDKAQRLTSWEQRNIIDGVTEIGFMSKAVREKVLSRNSHHTPMRMLMDEWGDPYRKSADAKTTGGKKAHLLSQKLGRKQKGAEKVGLQALKVGFGDEYVYVSPIEEMIRRSHEAVSFIERQKAANHLVDTMKRLKMTHKMGEPIPGISPQENSLLNYLDTMDDFHMERVNSLPGGLQPADSIRYFKDGKTEYWRMDPDLLDAVAGMTPEELSKGNKILAAYAHFLRLGATGTPRFAIKNIMRDPQSQALFTEEGGFKWDPILGLFHLMGRGDVAEAFIRSGGGHATQATLEANFDLLKQYGYDALVLGKRMGEIKSLQMMRSPGLMNKVKGAAYVPLEGLRDMAQASEQAARMGHFNRLRLMRESKKAKWYDPRYTASKMLKFKNDYTVGVDKAIHAFFTAGEKDTRLGRFLDVDPSLGRAKKAFKEYKDRDFDYFSTLKAIREGSLDFHKIGSKTRWLNRVRAFTNAGLQDPYKLATSFAERPYSTMLRVTNGIVLPSAYFWWQWKDDPDYAEEPDWKKAMFFYVGKTEDGWIRIPKPFLPGVIFGFGTEMGLQHAWDTDPQGTSEFFESFFASDEVDSIKEQTIKASPLEMAGPNASPDLVATAWQLGSNEDWFRDGAPIVPKSMQDASPHLQRNTYTSPSVAAATDVIRPVTENIPHTDFLQSPKQAEWLTSEVAGGTGRMAVDMADFFYRKANDMPPDVSGPQGLSEFFGISSRQSSGFGSKSVRKFYDKLKEYEQYKIDLGQMRGDEDAYKAYRRKHETELKKFAKLDAHSTKMSMLASQRAEIYANKSLTSDQRRKALRKKDDEIREEAKKGLIAIGI